MMTNKQYHELKNAKLEKLQELISEEIGNSQAEYFEYIKLDKTEYRTCHLARISSSIKTLQYILNRSQIL